MPQSMQSFCDLLPEQYRSPGLSDVELRIAQERAETIFPPDLSELLV